MSQRIPPLTAVPCFPNWFPPIDLELQSANHWCGNSLISHNNQSGFFLPPFLSPCHSSLLSSFSCSRFSPGQGQPDFSIFAFVAYLISSEDGKAMWFVDLAGCTLSGMCTRSAHRPLQANSFHPKRESEKNEAKFSKRESLCYNSIAFMHLYQGIILHFNLVLACLTSRHVMTPIQFKIIFQYVSLFPGNRIPLWSLPLQPSSLSESQMWIWYPAVLRSISSVNQTELGDVPERVFENSAKVNLPHSRSNCWHWHFQIPIRRKESILRVGEEGEKGWWYDLQIKDYIPLMAFFATGPCEHAHASNWTPGTKSLKMTVTP